MRHVAEGSEKPQEARGGNEGEMRSKERKKKRKEVRVQDEDRWRVGEKEEKNRGTKDRVNG